MKNGVACVPAPDILEFQICCVCTRWKYLYRSFKHSICFLSFKQAMAPPFCFFIGLCKGTSSWSKSAESRWFGVTQQQDARFAAEQFMCFQFATFCNQKIRLRLAMCSWGSQGWCGWLLGISCRCLLITGHESWQSWPWMIAQYNHSISQHHLIWLCFANHHRNPWYLYLLVPYLQVELPCMESLMVMGQRVTDVLLLQEVPHVIWLVWPTHDIPWHPMTHDLPVPGYLPERIFGDPDLLTCPREASGASCCHRVDHSWIFAGAQSSLRWNAGRDVEARIIQKLKDPTSLLIFLMYAALVQVQVRVYKV